MGIAKFKHARVWEWISNKISGSVCLSGLFLDAVAVGSAEEPYLDSEQNKEENHKSQEHTGNGLQFSHLALEGI